MTLDRFRQRFNATRRFVDAEGRLTNEASKLIDELLRSFDSNSDTANTDITAVETTANTAQTTATTAQTSADNAGSYWVNTPSSQAWNTDTSGVHEAGDPTQDILFTLFDKTGSSIATRTIRGQLTTATGLVSLSTTGTPTGLTTTVAFDPVGNNSATVKALITATFGDGSQTVGTAAWSAVDETVAGGTPGSGAGK